MNDVEEREVGYSTIEGALNVKLVAAALLHSSVSYVLHLPAANLSCSTHNCFVITWARNTVANLWKLLSKVCIRTTKNFSGEEMDHASTEEFMDVSEKMMHIFDSVNCRDGETDVKDPVESVYNSFTHIVRFAITMLKHLEKKQLTVDVKNSLRALKLELIFLITTFRCVVKWCVNADGIERRFVDILARIQCQFLCANRALNCFRTINLSDGKVGDAISILREDINNMNLGTLQVLNSLSINSNVVIEFANEVAAISIVQENIKIMKPEIVEAYYALSTCGSPSKYPMSAELVVQFICFVIDTLEILLRSSCATVSSWKCKLLALIQKLKFLEKIICFMIDLLGIYNDKLKEMLVDAESVADMAACLSFFIWVEMDSEVDEKNEIKKLIYPSSSRISAGILRTLEQLDSCLLDRIEESFFICLQENVIELLNHEALLKAPLQNQIETLYDELKFLEDVKIKMPILFPEQKIRFSVGIYIEDMARRIGSIIYSSSFNGENMPGVSDSMEYMKADVDEILGKVITRQKSKFPKILPKGFLDFLVEDLEELISTNIDLKDQYLAIHGDLVFMKSFLHHITKYAASDVNLYDVVNRIMVSTYEAEHVINTLLVRAYPFWYQSMWFSDFAKEMKLSRTVIEEMIEKSSNGNKVDNIADQSPKHVPPLQEFGPNDAVVGVQEDQMELVKERLAGGTEKLTIVSIVGMPGLGKTTLAKRLYDDPLIVYHFYLRGWCYVSPYYQKNQMLLSILSSVTKLTDEMHKLKDEDLSEMLYKQLKGRRYLIVMDDVWGIDALEALSRFFPDDGVGSRVMLTSRSKLIGSEARCHSFPIELRLLSDDESWDLLKTKVFHQGICPLQLQQVGKQIAQKCNGLPLAVVLVAGLLVRSDKKRCFWEQVSENLSSHILSDARGQGMEVLELSYKLLPDDLKPLFLYLGVFPVDRVIPVRKLTWLWISEGFVQKTSVNSLEDEAEKMLMDLIGRSLVIIEERRYNGRVKTCRMHDLLRDLCLAKAEEENFLQRIHVEKLLPDPLIYEHMRVSIHVTERKGFQVYCGPTMRSLLLFSDGGRSSDRRKNSKFQLSNLKLLRVLDLESDAIQVECHFDDQEMLVHLRYLAIWRCYNSVPFSIFNHCNLETLIVRRLVGEVVVPLEIWKMAKLRHLHINKSAKFILGYIDNDSPKLLNLETFSTPSMSEAELNTIMARTPNLRKLRCTLMESTTLKSPKFVFPDKLESLKALHRGYSRHLCEFGLPLSLKKLTISKFRLKWDVVSGFQALPNLEVLKLVDAQIEGELWDLGEGEFPKLKLLRLDSLSIKKWNASSDNFPRLEQLVIQKCWRLVEIPSSLGDICSLRLILVQWCSPHVAKSVKEIEEEQMDYGNDFLKTHIYPPYDPS